MPAPLRLAFVAFALAALPAPARAIGEQSGRVAGGVHDVEGRPIAGAVLTLRGRNLIGGPRTGRSDAAGGFVFLGVPPGDYQVEAAAAGLLAAIERDVRVGPDRTAQVAIVLVPEAAGETYVVKAQTRALDPTDTTAGLTLSHRTTARLPTDRSYQGSMLLAPGVRDVVGGGNPQVKGGQYRHNRYLVDGVDTTDPVTGTFSANFNFDAIQDQEVLTSGLEAEYNAPGGVVNLVTKSGSNDFEVDASVYANHQRLSRRTAHGPHPLHGPLLDQPGAGREFEQYQANVNVGGPLARDRLWYFASLEYDFVQSQLPTAPGDAAHDPRTFHGVLARGKLTWQPAPAHRLQLGVSGDPASISNTLQDPTVADAAEVHQDQGGAFAYLRWDWLPSEDWLVKAQVGALYSYLRIFPEQGGFSFSDPGAAPVGRFDVDTGTVTGGALGDMWIDDRYRLQQDASVTRIADGPAGAHELKAGVQLAQAFNPQTVAWSGGGQFTDSSAAGACDATFDPDGYTLTVGARDEGCLQFSQFGVAPDDNPYSFSTFGQEFGVFVQDRWRPHRRLTLKPGVRWDLGRYYANVDDDDAEELVMQLYGFGPRLAAAYDLGGDGRTRLTAGYARIVELGNLVAPYLVARKPVVVHYEYDAAAGAYVEQFREGGPSGYLREKHPSPPRVDEVDVGLARELAPDLALGLDFSYRRYANQFEDVETNLVWDERGEEIVDLRDPANPNPVFRFGTFPEAWRRYLGVDLWVRGNPAPRTELIASYTYARLRGTTTDLASRAFDLSYQRRFEEGFLPEDQRHTIQLHGAHEFRFGLTLGGSFRFATGTPGDRLFLNPVFGDYLTRRSPRGTDPGDPDDPADDVEVRLPAVVTLDLRAVYSLARLTGQRIDLIADLFNAMDLAAPTEVEVRDLPTWGQVQDRQSPFRAQLGVRYQY